jgi:hypothetical protein
VAGLRLSGELFQQYLNNQGAPRMRRRNHRAFSGPVLESLQENAAKREENTRQALGAGEWRHLANAQQISARD